MQADETIVCRLAPDGKRVVRACGASIGFSAWTFMISVLLNLRCCDLIGMIIGGTFGDIRIEMQFRELTSAGAAVRKSIGQVERLISEHIYAN